MHVLRLSIAPLAAAVLNGSAGARTASGAVTLPRTVSGDGLNVEHFALAMNPSGERSAVAFEGLVLGARVRLAVAGPSAWEPTVTLAPVGPVTPRTRPETSVLGDERPGGADLAIAAGRSGALLAFATFVQTGGDDGLVGTLHVAGYRP